MTDLPAFAKLAAARPGPCRIHHFASRRQRSVVGRQRRRHATPADERAGRRAGCHRRRPQAGHLRADPRTTIDARAGWQWATVEGSAQLIGPDDPHPDVDDERLRVLLREIFTAAGGTHDDWDTYDRVMRDQRRTAVLISPTRVYTNPNRG